jgi:hypothetical protein
MHAPKQEEHLISEERVIFIETMALRTTGHYKKA